MDAHERLAAEEHELAAERRRRVVGARARRGDGAEARLRPEQEGRGAVAVGRPAAVLGESEELARDACLGAPAEDEHEMPPDRRRRVADARRGRPTLHHAALDAAAPLHPRRVVELDLTGRKGGGQPVPERLLQASEEHTPRQPPDAEAREGGAHPRRRSLVVDLILLVCKVPVDGCTAALRHAAAAVLVCEDAVWLRDARRDVVRRRRRSTAAAGLLLRLAAALWLCRRHRKLGILMKHRVELGEERVALGGFHSLFLHFLTARARSGKDRAHTAEGALSARARKDGERVKCFYNTTKVTTLFRCLL